MSVLPAGSSISFAGTNPDAQVLDLLHAAGEILCVSHVSPDGDAVGSLLGLGWMLRELGKKTTLVLPDPPSPDFAYLPGFEEIVAPESLADASRYDLLICVDASSADRMGAVYEREGISDLLLLVIDHHITNTHFGDVNWVAPECAAVAQMLVYLAPALGVGLTAEITPALLTGIVTDTLCFQTTNTDAGVLRAAMQLVEAGGNLNQIVQNTLRRQSLRRVKLWAQVLPEVSLEDGVIWTQISLAQRRKAGVGAAESDGLSSFLVTVDEADISATFLEKKPADAQRDATSLIECSFRAKPGFDVSAVALAFGGGGHPAAAGCSVPGTLDAVVQQVVPALQRARCEQQSISAGPDLCG